MQKKNYREEKKRATKELLSTITDPSVIVMADWLKVGPPHLFFPSVFPSKRKTLQVDTFPSADPRHAEELDQAVVRAEAGRPPHIQDSQKRPVGGNGAAERLRAHREAVQEGRLLLQALSPAGAVHLGSEGQNTQQIYITSGRFKLCFILKKYFISELKGQYCVKLAFLKLYVLF